METYASALLVAIPLFTVLIVVEAVYGARKGVQTLNSLDTISSLSSGVTNVVKDSLGIVLVIISYPFIRSQLAIVELPNTWWVYVVGFIAVDFAGYWSHRLNHSINFFWNNHVIHHSSEEFNLACALRQSVSNLLGYYAIFLIPAALLGIPHQVINLIAPVHLFLQFWYHTQHVPKLGWLEYVIITPSQHRVHHAINPEYLDKNLGQIFTWWDRLFGTFQEELDEVEPVYGITRPAKTWNPIRINFQHIWLLAKDAWRTDRVADKLRIWFMPTGWRPPDVETRFPVDKIEDPYYFEKYQVNASPALKGWAWFQFLSTTGMLLLMLARFGDIGSDGLALFGAFLFISVFGYTSMMDMLPWAPWFEVARSLLGLAGLGLTSSWLGLGPIPTYLVAGYLLVTAVGSPVLAKRSSSRLATAALVGFALAVSMGTSTVAAARQAPDAKPGAEHSVARQWNDVLLEHIRNDFARPTVHARNLFHTSIAMYDIWALHDGTAGPYMLGDDACPADGYPLPTTPIDRAAATDEAISFAMFRLLEHRFAESPGLEDSAPLAASLMVDLGYEAAFVGTDLTTGDGAALGNYMAECLIAYGLADGSNEADGYNSRFYEPVNPPLRPDKPGTPELVDPDRWQPLTLEVFIDQGNNTIDDNTPGFLGPEWGYVKPFALEAGDLEILERGGTDWWLYHDPGTPPSIHDAREGAEPNAYQWGFTLVSAWSSHLDPADGVMWDISPGAIGNLPTLPQSVEEYPDFYNLAEGGDPSAGHATNPATGLPYEPQMVPRADYARVLAEFWADGPESETPPGHWFTILNYVNDHPLFERRFRGQGEVIDPLEWDVKAYFSLAGAVHDSAVAAWSIKGWHDYIRPISALRSMASRGQSSDNTLPNYDPLGLPLLPGFVELITADDPLAGDFGQHVDKVKLYAWRGPDYIEHPETDLAGVGWILAEEWWPYQRPSFVTPPFAGYISGHSTFSRAAAEVMTLLTGDPFFPGGLGEFVARQNEFLVFEEGPSQDVVLQWATYRDASDQTSLSRIWGGIHPPADDIPGRLIGETIGVRAFAHAEDYFAGTLVAGLEASELPEGRRLTVFPNPVQAGRDLHVEVGHSRHRESVALFDVLGRRIVVESGIGTVRIGTHGLAPGVYLLRRDSAMGQEASVPVVVVR